jgi:hypothetical protein
VVKDWFLKMVAFLVYPVGIQDVVNSPFLEPKKKYYFGTIKHGCPWFLYPNNFNKYILSFKKLKLISKEELSKLSIEGIKKRKDIIFSNFPTIRRLPNFTFKMFKSYYYLALGYPIAIRKLSLGWKSKWDMSRYEWSPSFMVYFFNWQFCIWWNSPIDSVTTDSYYEMYLWYKNWCNKDLNKARKEWPYTDYYTKKSTWEEELTKKTEEDKIIEELLYYHSFNKLNINKLFELENKYNKNLYSLCVENGITFTLNKDTTKIYSRYNEPRFLTKTAPNTYIYFGTWLSMRIGGEKNNIEFIDPDGGPWLGIGYPLKDFSIKEVIKSITSLKNNKYCIKTMEKGG